MALEDKLVWGYADGDAMKQLGVKANKTLNPTLVESATPGLTAAEELAAIALSNTPRDAGAQGTPGSGS